MEMEQMACGIIEGQRQVFESIAAPPRWQLARPDGRTRGQVAGSQRPVAGATAGPWCHCTSRGEGSEERASQRSEWIASGVRRWRLATKRECRTFFFFFISIHF